MAPKRRRRRLVLAAETDGRFRLLTETLRGHRIAARSEHRDGAQDLGDWAPLLAKKTRTRSGMPVGVRLSAGSCLSRTTSVPWSAAGRLRDILGLELERVTPFRRGDVYFDHLAADRPTREGKLAAEQIILERSRIDPTIAELKDRGVTVGFVDCWDASGRTVRPINLLGPELKSSNRTRGGGALLTGALALSVAVLAILVVLQDVGRYREALASIDAQLLSSRSEMATLRKSRQAREATSGQAASLMARRQSQVAVVQAIEQLSRQLPDDSWLTSLHVEGKVVDLAGFSKSAATLVNTMDSGGTFDSGNGRKVRFGHARLTAPITFDTSRNREQFALRLTVDDRAPDASAQVSHNLSPPVAALVTE